MKKIFFIVLIIFNFFPTYGQIITCKDFEEGVFQFEGTNGGFYTIIRTHTTQFERNTKMAQHSTMKIKWTYECNYTLYDFTEHKWGQKPTKNADISEIKNVVYKVQEPNKFYVKTYFENFEDTVETIFYKIDTTKYYNNIFELEKYKEYKNSNSYGQTILGEIYSIDYYQSNLDETKYIITFESTFQLENRNKSTLLDSKIIQVNKDENITNSNCRYHGEYDDEILTVFKSTDNNKEAEIIQAYRFNRESKLIEAVDKTKVKYKVADQTRIKL
jgi:hypothetical protein